MNSSFFTVPKEQIESQPDKLKYIFLIFSMFYFFRWFYAPMPHSEWAIQIGAYVAFLLLYFAAFKYVRYVVILSFAMVGLSIALAPQNQGANAFAIFAANFFAYTLPAKRAALLISIVIGLMGLATYALKLPIIGYFLIGSTIALAGGLAGIITRQDILHKQKQYKSQAEINRLAKIAERERISQDLHDLLGHSLTIIHLKSDLCLQKINNNLINDAKTEIAAIRDTAQNAIKEVRAAVTGYKLHNLNTELQAQKLFLESMGIELNYRLPDTILPPILESDFLFITREALTNVLRHANATHCNINCTSNNDGTVLAITDNGKGMASTQNIHSSSGITGITRRVESRGGKFSLNTNNGVSIDIFIPWASDDAKT